MKEDVELAKAILGPRLNSQQIDPAIKKPLEQLARAIQKADSVIFVLEEKIKELEKQLIEHKASKVVVPLEVIKNS